MGPGPAMTGVSGTGFGLFSNSAAASSGAESSPGTRFGSAENLGTDSGSASGFGSAENLGVGSLRAASDADTSFVSAVTIFSACPGRLAAAAGTAGFSGGNMGTVITMLRPSEPGRTA